MEKTTPPATKTTAPEKKIKGFKAVDPAVTQAIAERVGKQLGKPADKVTVVEASEELQKTADEMGSS